MLLLLFGLTDKGNYEFAICFFDLFAFRLRCGKIICYSHFLTFEKADIISQCHNGFPHEMTCEEEPKKFHSDEVLPPRSG